MRREAAFLLLAVVSLLGSMATATAREAPAAGTQRGREVPWRARRDELEAMASKERIRLGPPWWLSYRVLGYGGAGSFLMQVGRLPVRPGRSGAGVLPSTQASTTFEMSNTDELRKAIRRAVDAYTAYLPALDRQRKTMTATRPRGQRPTRAQAEAAMAAAEEASRAVRYAEADVQLLLAHAWLGAAADRLGIEESKAAAAETQRSLARCLALRPRIAEIDQEVVKEAYAIRSGLVRVITELRQQEQDARFFGGKPAKVDEAPPVSGGRPHMGVDAKDLAPEEAARLKLKVKTGVIVTYVRNDSPAAVAGLVKDDVIQAVDGTPLKSRQALKGAIAGRKPGDVLALTILRGEQELALKVKLGGIGAR